MGRWEKEGGRRKEGGRGGQTGMALYPNVCNLCLFNLCIFCVYLPLSLYPNLPCLIYHALPPSLHALSLLPNHAPTPLLNLPLVPPPLPTCRMHTHLHLRAGLPAFGLLLLPLLLSSSSETAGWRQTGSSMSRQWETASLAGKQRPNTYLLCV